MRVSIIGATGYIGSNLLNYLRNNRSDISRITILVRDKTKLKPNINSSNIKIVQGDQLNRESLKDTISDSQIIYYCAGLAWNNNALKEHLLQNTVSAFLLGKILRPNQKVIWLSTTAVDIYLSKIEQGNWSIFNNGYPLSKYFAQTILEKLSKNNIQILKISDVYGPGQDISEKIINPTVSARRIQRFIAAYKLIKEGNISWIPDNGDKLFGFYKKRNEIIQEIIDDFINPTYIDDIIEIIIRAGEAKNIKKGVLEVQGVSITNSELVKQIMSFFNMKVGLKIKRRENLKRNAHNDFKLLGFNRKKLITFHNGLNKWFLGGF